jgi:hypothetical protein
MTWENDDAHVVDLVDDYTVDATLVISAVSLRIRLGPGGKLLIMLIFESTTVRKVYYFITDKEAQNDFRVEYKRHDWSYSFGSRVVDMVDNFVVNVHVVSRDGLKGGGKAPRLKLATTRAVPQPVAAPAPAPPVTAPEETVETRAGSFFLLYP